MELTLKSFVDEDVKPKLKSVEELKRLLETDAYKPFTLRGVINDEIDRLSFAELSRSDLREIDLDIEEPINIESADEPENPTIQQVLQMNSGLNFVEGTFECTATVNAYMFLTDALGLEEEGRIYVSDWHWNEHYVAVEIEGVYLTVNFSFTFDRKTGEIESFTVIDVVGSPGRSSAPST